MGIKFEKDSWGAPIALYWWLELGCLADAGDGAAQTKVNIRVQ